MRERKKRVKEGSKKTESKGRVQLNHRGFYKMKMTQSMDSFLLRPVSSLHKETTATELVFKTQ